MPSRVQRASRRTVLAGGSIVGVALLSSTVAGCGTASSDAGAPALSSDADDDLVATVGDDIAAVRALAAATAASYPALRPLGRRLTRLHDAHLSELGRTADRTAGAVHGSVDTARSRLLRREERLQQQLVAAAVDADSGPLAQLFASMAAAILQQRTVAG